MVAIFMVLGVLLAPAMRSWLTQQRKIQALERDISQQRSRIADLQRQQIAWKDSAFVQAQARDRLKFVLPGDRAFTTLTRGQNGVTAPAPSVRTPKPSPTPPQSKRAWYGTLWGSVQSAGGST